MQSMHSYAPTVSPAPAPLTVPATPAQADAMAEVTRIVQKAADPAAAAEWVLTWIAAEKSASGCTALNGQCVRHELDGDEVVHRGPEHSVSAGGDKHLLSHTLVQWGDDDPFLEFVGGYEWPDLDVPEVDDVIGATARQLASLIACRAHLVAAVAAKPRRALVSA